MKRKRLAYNAAFRNEHFNIRRGEPVRNGKASGEHRSEVHTRDPKKEQK